RSSLPSLPNWNFKLENTHENKSNIYTRIPISNTTDIMSSPQFFVLKYIVNSNTKSLKINISLLNHYTTIFKLHNIKETIIFKPNNIIETIKFVAVNKKKIAIL